MATSYKRSEIGASYLHNKMENISILQLKNRDDKFLFDHLFICYEKNENLEYRILEIEVIQVVSRLDR